MARKLVRTARSFLSKVSLHELLFSLLSIHFILILRNPTPSIKFYLLILVEDEDEVKAPVIEIVLVLVSGCIVNVLVNVVVEYEVVVSLVLVV